MSDSLPEDYGQGDNGVTEDVTTDSTAVVSDENTEESISPIWSKALENVPQEFHSQLLPTFKEWDGNYGKDKEKLAKFEQYSPFLESNVPPEDINNALEIANILQSRPRELFDYLRNQFNFTVEEANAAVEENEAEDFDLATDGFDLTKHPQYIQQQQEIQMLKQFNETQQQNQVREQMRSQIDSEVASVKEQFPMFDIADVAAMATGLSQAHGKLPNLIEAAQHMAKMMPQSRVSDSAPPTVSGNRGIPSNKPNLGQMSSEERSAYVASLIEAQNRQ